MHFKWVAGKKTEDMNKITLIYLVKSKEKKQGCSLIIYIIGIQLGFLFTALFLFVWYFLAWFCCYYYLTQFLTFDSHLCYNSVYNSAAFYIISLPTNINISLTAQCEAHQHKAVFVYVGASRLIKHFALFFLNVVTLQVERSGDVCRAQHWVSVKSIIIIISNMVEQQVET